MAILDGTSTGTSSDTPPGARGALAGHHRNGLPRIYCLFCLALPWTVFVTRELARAASGEGVEETGGWYSRSSWFDNKTEAFREQPAAMEVAATALQKPLLEPLDIRPGGIDQCNMGIWNLTLELEDKGKCNLRSSQGRYLCSGGVLHVAVEADECSSFQLVTVPSCSSKDLKCKKFNCQKFGVQRLEDSKGDLVDVGTGDKMLMCGNLRFNISGRQFCYKDPHLCLEQTWTTTTTTPAMPVPAASDVLVGVSPTTLTPAFNACALVGSSSNLEGKGLGAEIDGHDTVIRINRVPKAAYFADFGEKVDIFFSHEQNVANSGLSIRFMDGELKHCGQEPTNVTCSPVEAFVWLTFQSGSWIEKYQRLLRSRSRAESIHVGATKLHIGCVAQVLLGYASTEQRHSTGFAAFLTFGYLCQTLRLYGFGGPGTIADKSVGVAKLSRMTAGKHSYSLEHDVMNKIISGDLSFSNLRPGEQKCPREGLSWFRRSMPWFSKSGRITVAGSTEGTTPRIIQ